MGSCQSTEIGRAETPKSVIKQVPIVQNDAQSVQSKAGSKVANNTAGTYPGDDNSIDESIKSFGSQRSGPSVKSSTTTPKSNEGYSSEIDSSRHSVGESSSAGSFIDDVKPKRSLKASSSIIGLDTMIESRREEGNLQSNVVHMEVPFGKPIEEVYDGVHTGPVLGSGISGLVRLVTHKATGVKYAVKVLDLGLVDTEDGLTRLREEIFIMCQLDHPNIVRLEEVYESHSEIYLVQELCVGGELFDRLEEQPDYRYTEAECARLVKQMLCACRYLHSKGIIHRDLKLENFLFSSTDRDAELKMIDFGLSKHFRYGDVQHEAVGTPYAVAPEVIRGSYDERCDIWAIGVIAFLLLSGDPPFGGCGGPEPLLTVRSNILAGVYAFEPAEIWELVSDGARSFIKALLVVNPKDRPTAGSAQKLPWMVEWADRNRSAGDNVLNPNVVKALINFKEYSDMRKLLCEVLSFTLLPDQIKELRKEFEKMDTDGSGEISLAALKQVLVTNAGTGSLGALTEEEVEDIFNAMRVNKTTETRIHWHEFIAAGLSQCKVDDRNLRLAFERLDSDHKGYITLDDITDMLGNDALHSEDLMREMWGDSMKAMNCSQARITYEDFLLLMKGQTRDASDSLDGDRVRGSNHKCTALQLGVLMEEQSDDLTYVDVTPTKIHQLDLTLADSVSQIPLILNPVEEAYSIDGPLSMDEDDDISGAAVKVPPRKATPPSSPSRVATTLSPLRAGPDSFSQLPKASTTPDFLTVLAESTLPSIPKPRPYVRTRSRSYEANKTSESMEAASLHMFFSDSRRAICLPEHDKERLQGIVQQSKTALQQNRNLYRAHRQMRLSVLEASKQFEEQQARHARDVLLAQEELRDMKKGSAGLVMRRVENKTVSTEQVKNLLEQNQKYRLSIMEVASRRSGRRNRTKTISDIGGMLGSLSQEEVTKCNETVSNGTDDLDTTVPEIIDTSPSEDIETNPRGATVPGEFRKVNDPFGAHGKYRHYS